VDPRTNGWWVEPQDRCGDDLELTLEPGAERSLTAQLGQLVDGSSAAFVPVAKTRVTDAGMQLRAVKCRVAARCAAAMRRYSSSSALTDGSPTR
jgi:hypothetical protein